MPDHNDYMASRDAASSIDADDIIVGVDGTTGLTKKFPGSLFTTDVEWEAHLDDTVDAHDASAISVVPGGTLSATDAQAAFEELRDTLDAAVIAAGNVPLGGDAGTILRKVTGADNDVEWTDHLTIDDIGNVVFRASDLASGRIDLTTNARSRPTVGYIDVLRDDDVVFPKWLTRGAVYIWEHEDPPEVGFRRTHGDPYNESLAITTLATEITDVTALSGATIQLDANDIFGKPLVRAFSGGIESFGGGKVLIGSGTHIAVCTYDDVDPDLNTLTGVTYEADTLVGAALFAVGSSVSRIIEGNQVIGTMYGAPDHGLPGFQTRLGAVTFRTAGDQRPDGWGGFYGPGQVRVMTLSPGPRSRRIDQLAVHTTGAVYILGTRAGDPETGPVRRFVVGAKQTLTRDLQTIPTPSSTPYDIRVWDPSLFPTTGTLEISTSAGDEEIAYTGWEAIDGFWYFTGCTGGTAGATIADGREVNLASWNLGVVGGFRGNVMAFDLGTAQQTELGAIGPTVSAPEGGIKVGSSGPTRFYRAESAVWSMHEGNKLRGFAATGETVVFETRVTGDTLRRIGLRANGKIGWSNGTDAADVFLKRSDVGELNIRDAADTADANLRAGIVRASSRLRLDDATDPGATGSSYVRLLNVNDGDGSNKQAVRLQFRTGNGVSLARLGYFAMTDAATVAVDAARGPALGVTLAGNRAMGAPTNPTDGVEICLAIRQDGTGGRTVTWPSGAGGYRFSATYPQPVLSTAAGAVDYVWFKYNLADDRWDCIGTVGALQPLDADLTAIAALATTAFGRSLLTQADAVTAQATLDVDSEPDVQSFTTTATHTWNRPTGNFKRCRIGFAAPGGAGGSGRKGAAGTVRCAGGGGGHGAQGIIDIPFSDLPSSLTITIPAPGTGGAAVTADDTNGNPGGNGGTLTIVGTGIDIRTTGGNGGNGGTNAAGTGGSAISVGMFTATAGANAAAAGGAGNNASAATNASGPAGGGITTGNVFAAGGTGRAAIGHGLTNVAPAGGATDGANGTAATAITIVQVPPSGVSGGGGASSVLGNAGAGGAGAGWGYGGSGGGAAVNGVGNSGAGSDGGPGAVIIICY